MDIRKVQRTGAMHYLYLPTLWCKKNRIEDGSKVSLTPNADGSLNVSSTLAEKNKKDIVITSDDNDPEIIHKLIVASYINPTASFKIKLKKPLDPSHILNQKKLISVELVELDGNTITCESSISIGDPEAILKTMISKVKNLIYVILHKYNEELIERYEEEIDRSKLLIDKAVIAHFTQYETYKLSVIDLHYISLIAKTIEGLVDHIIRVNKREKKFLEQVMQIINHLKDFVEQEAGLNYATAITFIQTISALEDIEVTSVATYDKKRIRQLLFDISEVLTDWAVTKEVVD